MLGAQCILISTKRQMPRIEKLVRSSFQERIRGIPGSIPRGNNAWSVRMPLRISRISRPSLVGRKPVRKQKKKNW